MHKELCFNYDMLIVDQLNCYKSLVPKPIKEIFLVLNLAMKWEFNHTAHHSYYNISPISHILTKQDIVLGVKANTEINKYTCNLNKCTST